MVGLLLMALFAAGVIGCAITIPICAVKFLAVLFEGHEEQPKTGAYGNMPLYATPAATQPEAPAEEPSPPRPPQRRGSGALQ